MNEQEVRAAGSGWKKHVRPDGQLVIVSHLKKKKKKHVTSFLDLNFKIYAES